MTKGFWVIAAGWVIGVLASMPSAIRQMDDGAGVTLPGFSPTLTEVFITAGVALLPPLLAAAVIRRRRGR